MNSCNWCVHGTITEQILRNASSASWYGWSGGVTHGAEKLVIRGTLVGLVVLGIGGRLLMRVIAHMENRAVLVLTIQGTLTVLFAGTVAGALGGLIYYFLRRFVRQPWVCTSAFIAIYELIIWLGVHTLLPRPQVMFMALALVYLVIIDVMGWHRPVANEESLEAAR